MTDPEVFKGGKKEKTDKDALDHGKKAHVEAKKKSPEKKEAREELASMEFEMAYKKRWDDASRLSAECMKDVGKVDDAEAALENIIALPKDHAEKDPKLLKTMGVHAPIINDAIRAQDEEALRKEMTGMVREIDDATRESVAESSDTAEVSSEP
ncbi:MAG: hypothetical protein QF741_03325 [Candidatus Peribacteraceae bacterium]|jgi:hypothetical protein|nr:hypothetical protein [Candidatus Peribacteraceae bacterium]MDP7454029.1 hypothetical protein [Candidatus Peribacteraceae bacterium]MDP7645916.1 hypothetical protein [Candidatus Peribacteraceae bacterium]|tara:strand:+ start:2224 stop:2685 length:462 start_codon:yes stop_codon:yes gene_type:complete